MQMTTVIIRRNTSQQDFESLKYQMGQLFKSSKHDLKVKFEEDKETRKLKQNALLWVFNNALKKHIELSEGLVFGSDDIHEYMANLLLPKRVVQLPNSEPFITRSETKKLKVGKFAEYLTRYEQIAMEKWNCALPHPDDLYMDALCKHVQERETNGYSHFRVIGLCPTHHRHGPDAVHVSPAAFQRKFGHEEDLLKQALELLGD
jgi:hypothetical protein